MELDVKPGQVAIVLDTATARSLEDLLRRGVGSSSARAWMGRTIDAIEYACSRPPR